MQKNHRLNGPSSPFPPLNNLTNIRKLILRSCNITGFLPDYLDGMKSLELLDLSFNKIGGQIPTSFHSLENVDNIFLTGKLLNGSVPEWMLLRGNSINLVSCLADNICSKNLYRLHINCGGKEEAINGTKFEGDEDPGLSSVFVSSNTNWGFSNTGIYLKDGRLSIDYIELNSSELRMVDSKLYENARISPLSLTYYVYCMGNGNYTISLHFAEIRFTNGKTFSSLGRRIFDVYVQGRLVLKDFNIVDAAGGAGKSVTKKISTSVTGNTIEIRFYWAGKGACAIPVGGVYGPLISAISIEPDFEPPSKGRSPLPIGVILGIVAAAAIVIVSVLRILWWRSCFGRRSTFHQGISFVNLWILCIRLIVVMLNACHDRKTILF